MNFGTDPLTALFREEEGREEALKKLHHLVHAVAVLELGSTADAEDVTQEASVAPSPPRDRSRSLTSCARGSSRSRATTSPISERSRPPPFSGPWLQKPNFPHRRPQPPKQRPF